MVTFMIREPWHAEARCRGEARRYFFPPTWSERRDDKERRERQAKALCCACPVQIQCLEGALARSEPAGVWGGMNEIERRQLADGRLS